MSRFLGTVIANERILADAHLVTLRAGPVAREVAPGQFLHVRCGCSHDPLLRCPMSICRVDEEDLDIAVWTVGPASRWLAHQQPGSTIDCIGPQGRGFHLDRGSTRLLLVAEGSGVSPLVGLAERAVAQGSAVTLAVGAHTASEVIPARLLPPQVEYLVVTRDGSLGQKGELIQALSPWLPWADAIYASGTDATMASLAAYIQSGGARKRAEVAVSAPMACAVGACLTCTIETRRGQRRVCIDGPVFDLTQIVWGESGG